MRRFSVWARVAVLLPGLALVGSCVSSAQYSDFVRTEFARVTADLIGQFFGIALRANL